MKLFLRKYWYEKKTPLQYIRCCRYCGAEWVTEVDIDESSPVGSSLDLPGNAEIHKLKCPVKGVAKERE